MNGREKLIEATRLYLQSNRKMSLTRTEIAQGCGVTPALISYYFKDKRSLLQAVTKPLLHNYRARLASIFASPDGGTPKMHQVIRLLVTLTIDDAFLMDHILRPDSLEDFDAQDRIVVASFRTEISDLVRALLDRGEWRPMEPALAETALWGLCRAFGDAIRLQAGINADQLDRAARLADCIAFINDSFRVPSNAVRAAAGDDV